MELEIAMLGEHKLTLPTGTSPLDDFTRGAELDWLRRALVAIQREQERRVNSDNHSDRTTTILAGP